MQQSLEGHSPLYPNRDVNELRLLSHGVALRARDTLTHHAHPPLPGTVSSYSEVLSIDPVAFFSAFKMRKKERKKANTAWLRVLSRGERCRLAKK